VRPAEFALLSDLTWKVRSPAGAEPMFIVGAMAGG
jgi:hypothetical protein